MANEWIIERVGEHELKVTTPDSVTIKPNQDMTVEDLMYSLAMELVKRVAGGNTRCICDCCVGG